MQAGALEIVMFSNIARLVKDMAEAKSTVERSMKGIEGAVASAKSALAALGVGLSVGYFVSLIKGSIDAVDHLHDLHKTLDISVEKLSGLKLLAKQSGTDLDGLAASIAKLSQNIGKDQEKFAALGITAKDNVKAFQQLSDIFVKTQDPQQRAAVMAAALGKSWASAAPALAEGSKRIGEIIEQGARLSAATKSMGVNADEFNDTMAVLNTTLGATKTRLVADMLPGMTDIAKAMQEAAKEGGLLLTIWVGLGGAMAHLLGITDGQKVKARLKEINDEVDRAQKQMQAGSTNPDGIFGWFIPNVKVSEAALANLRKTIDTLNAEKARLTPPAPVENPAIDPAIAAAQAAKNAAFLQGEKEAKLAAAELLKYENALRSLMDQLGKFQNMTLEEKTLRDLNIGSLKGLTKAHGEHLVSVAKQVDAERTLEAIAKSSVVAIEAQIAAQDELSAGKVAFHSANQTAAKDIAFETSLIRLNDVEREKANALRKIELDYIKQSAAISEIQGLKAQAAALADLDAARARAIAGITTEIDAKTSARVLDEKLLEQMRFEVTLIGLTNVEREKAIAIRNLELTGIDQTTEAYQKYVAQLKNVIEAKSAADEMKQAQVSMWQEVDRVARDTFVSIFDSGKSTFERLRDTLKNTLFALLYQMTLRPFLIQVVTSAAGAGVAQSVFGAAASAGGGAGGIGNLLSTGNSLYSALSGNTSSFLSGLFGSSSAAASGIGLSAAGLSSAALGAGALGATGSALGLSATGTGLGLSAAGVNAAAIGTGAAGAGGAMAAISTALPYIGIAIAAASMLGLFGGKKTAAVGTGYNFYGDYDPSGAGMLNLTSQGLTNVGPEPPIFRDPSGNHPATAYRTSVGGTVDELLRLAREIGLATDTLRPVSFSTGVSGVGQAAEDSSIPVVAGQIAEALAEQLIPGLKSMALENETLLATFVRLQQQVKLTDQIIEILGLNTGTAFRGVGAEAIKLRDELITLMGGMQNAASLTESFYQNFFTDAERFAIDSRRVNAAMHELGVTALPRTRAEFRLLVEVQDLNTRAGREMFAALMQLAPAFAAVTQVIDEAITNLNTLAGVRSAALTAIDEQIRASESAAQTGRRAADSYRQLTASLADAIVQLRGGDLSPLLPGQKLAEARSQLGTVYGLATAGDAAALARLPQVATDFLSASRGYNASSAAYTRDFADVMRMLEQASAVSENWNSYEVELLNLQTSVLEAIRAELTSPTSDTAVISQQSALLSTIQVLLGQQTSVILTGNAVQDVIRNITALDTAYSAEALRAMITGDSLQATGIAQVVSLLQQLVTLTAQQVAADAAAEAARIVEAASAAAAFAATAATAAITTAQTSVAAAIAATTPTTTLLPFESWAASMGYAAQDEEGWGMRYYGPGGNLALSEMRAMYRAAGGFAGGGLASGWSMVGEQGPELANFSSPARIYTASETRSALSGGISDEKLDKLHAVIEKGNDLLVEIYKRSSEDIKVQTKEINEGQKVAARETGNTIANAVFVPA